MYIRETIVAFNPLNSKIIGKDLIFVDYLIETVIELPRFYNNTIIII